MTTGHLIFLFIIHRLSMECPICVSSKKASHFLKCEGCGNDICKDCVTKGVLVSSRPPKCMMPECRQLFSMNTIKRLGKKASLKITEHFKGVLFSELVTDSFGYIERLKEKDEARIRILEHQFLKHIIVKQTHEIKILARLTGGIAGDESLEKMHAFLSGTGDTVPAPAGGAAPERDTQKKSTSKSKVFRCPIENCLGHVPVDSGVCVLCDETVCVSCGEHVEEKDGKHKCNKDIAKSHKKALDSCVPCPKCKTLIQRSSGCSQMWCTFPGCKTGFDYTTGERIKGTAFHNPHFFEELRRTGMNAAEFLVADVDFEQITIMCGGDITNIMDVSRRISHLQSVHSVFMAVVNFINDVWPMQRIERLGTTRTVPYEKLIFAYLNKTETQDTIQTKLLFNLRKQQRAESMAEIVTGTMNILRNMVVQLVDIEQRNGDVTSASKEFVSRSIEIIDSANRALIKAARDAGFTNTFRIVISSRTGYRFASTSI